MRLSKPRQHPSGLSAAIGEVREIAPGVAMAVVLAFVAVGLGQVYPLVGGPMFAIALGMAIRAVYTPSSRFRAGLQWASKRVLQVAIALLGAGLSVMQMKEVGLEALAILLLVVATACIVALGVGRMLGIGWRMNSLLAIGTSICGASAIATLSPVIEAEESEISYSITTVFLGSILAMAVFPAAAYALGMSQLEFGIWAGTAINDTSSVVATGFSYGSEAGEVATAVKLARTLLLVPLVLAFSFYVGRGRAGEKAAGKPARLQIGKAVPWFVVAFLVLAGLRTYGVIPAEWASAMSRGARSLIVVSLAAVGLTSDLRALKRVSWKPLFLGLLSSLAVSMISLLAIIVIRGVGG